MAAGQGPAEKAHGALLISVLAVSRGTSTQACYTLPCIAQVWSLPSACRVQTLAVHALPVKHYCYAVSPYLSNSFSCTALPEN